MVKKVKFVIFALIIFIANISENKSFVYASETTTYAKALVGCNLYKSDSLNSNIENIYFVVPETYFVIILENVNDNCYKVQYGRYIGYVESSTILIATFIPIVKTLDNIHFDIKTTSGTQIWSYPSAKSSICTTLAAGTKNIDYISYAFGEIPSGGESNIWYFVSFVPDNNSTNVYEGYIYSENTTNLSEIVSNFETNPEVINNDISDEKLLVVSSTLKTIVIAIIVIPIILFILIILYKLFKICKKNTNKHNIENNNLYDKNTKDKLFEQYHDMKKINKIEAKKLLQNFDENDDELL